MLLAVANYRKKMLEDLDSTTNQPPKKRLSVLKQKSPDQNIKGANSNLDPERKAVQNSIKIHITSFRINQKIKMTEMSSEKFKDFKVVVKVVVTDDEQTLNAEIEYFFLFKNVQSQ